MNNEKRTIVQDKEAKIKAFRTTVTNFISLVNNPLRHKLLVSYISSGADVDVDYVKKYIDDVYSNVDQTDFDLDDFDNTNDTGSVLDLEGEDEGE